MDALAAHLAAERRYWARLEVPFKELLVRLADDRTVDEYGAASYGERALPIWARTLRSTAYAAFDEATRSLDDSARGLKAVARAEQALGARLHRALGPFLDLVKPEEVIDDPTDETRV